MVVKILQPVEWYGRLYAIGQVVDVYDDSVALSWIAAGKAYDINSTPPPNSPIGDGTSQTYIHRQMSASDTWDIQHNLNTYPSVTIVDSGGTVVYGDVQYLSPMLIRVTFAAPFAGTAYLNA